MYDNDKQRMIKFKQKNKKKVEPQDIKVSPIHSFVPTRAKLR